MTVEKEVANRLINEKSPYLLQHAYNPVDWFPWGQEAFDKAKKEDKPIFLSIGYSTCHWCHVMERESFEDKEVAEVLNKNFVSIKVDREERPDIDSIYMTFCQAYTGSGGWPMTIIMTPDKKPFFAGTYFPKESNYGRPGIIELLESIHEMWKKDKKKLLDFSEELVNRVKTNEVANKNSNEEIKDDILEETVKHLKHYFDKKYGGFGRVPKFPTPHNIYFLMRYYDKTKDKDTLQMIEKTLQGMYKGGMFDHIGFGFARYSTDEKWLVPHFEKMLYDNALLAYIYTEGYNLTGNPLYKEIAEKVFTYLLRDMTSEEGGFYSAEDADSEGVDVLGEKDGEVYYKTYDITKKGNFEGKSIPNLIDKDLGEISKRELQNDLEKMREKLYVYRDKRVHPFKDDKILTSWNGLAIAAFSYGGKVLKNKEYIEAAEKAADFILKKLMREDGRLLCRYREGEGANLAFLEDYAFFIWGLIELYEAGSDSKYLKKAVELNDDMINLFGDTEEGGLYLYGNDSEKLIIRPKELYDGAIPSGNSVATLNMFRLSKIVGRDALKELGEKGFTTFGKAVNSNPTAYTFFITAYMLYKE